MTNRMSETLVILRRVKKVPAMASCSICNLKFFTPKDYSNDPIGAEEYLRKKFEEHRCNVTEMRATARRR